MEYETNKSMKTPRKNMLTNEASGFLCLFLSFFLFNPHVLSLRGKITKQLYEENSLPEYGPDNHYARGG